MTHPLTCSQCVPWTRFNLILSFPIFPTTTRANITRDVTGVVPGTPVCAQERNPKVEPYSPSLLQLLDSTGPAAKGYNCVQLMAIMEHSYYGSFGRSDDAGGRGPPVVPGRRGGLRVWHGEDGWRDVAFLKGRSGPLSSSKELLDVLAGLLSLSP